MTKEELEKELEEIKDFKVYVFEGDVYVKAEDYRKKVIENRNLKLIQETNEKQIQNDAKERDELREENEKLKEELNGYKM